MSKKKEEGRKHIVESIKQGLNAAANSDCNKIKLGKETYEVFIGALDASTFDPENVEKIAIQRRKINGKLTKEVADAIGIGLSKGLPILHVCNLLGVSRQSYYNWIKQAVIDRQKEQDTIYTYVLDCSEQGASSVIKELVQIVKDAAKADPKYWPAALQLLEKIDNEHFGKREKVEISGNKFDEFIQAVRNVTPNDVKLIDAEAGDAVPFDELKEEDEANP